MKAQAALALAIVPIMLGSVGCATISEQYIVGKDRRATMDYKRQNYTVIEQNGTTTFTLSPRGKVALQKHEEQIAKRKAFREARSNLVMPLANTVDWALSWPTVFIYGMALGGGGGGGSGGGIGGIGGGGGP